MFKMGPLPAVRTTKRVTFRSQLPLRFRGRRGEAPLPPPALSPPPSAPTPPVTATDQTQRSASANQAPTRTRNPACARINNGPLLPRSTRTLRLAQIRSSPAALDLAPLPLSQGTDLATILPVAPLSLPSISSFFLWWRA
jgi:hypothetical protein